MGHRVLNDYKCPGCGYSEERYCDPTEIVLCPCCLLAAMVKQMPSIVVGNPMKGRWNQSKKPVKQSKKIDKQYRDLGEMVIE